MRHLQSVDFFFLFSRRKSIFVNARDVWNNTKKRTVEHFVTLWKFFFNLWSL